MKRSSSSRCCCFCCCSFYCCLTMMIVASSVIHAPSEISANVTTSNCNQQEHMQGEQPNSRLTIFDFHNNKKRDFTAQTQSTSTAISAIDRTNPVAVEIMTIMMKLSPSAAAAAATETAKLTSPSIIDATSNSSEITMLHQQQHIATFEPNIIDAFTHSRRKTIYDESVFHKFTLSNKYKRSISMGRFARQADSDQVEKCLLFVEGNQEKNEFYSPDYPNNYPKNINCTRIITAPKGQIIRLDFRNSFHIEYKEECKFDFLEIRDGQYGFSNLLGKFCGTDFPPEITSKERYLWLHFHSDESIEYSGFTAVYEFIDRNREAPSTDLNCTIDKSGYEGFINSTDIPSEIRDVVIRNKIPLDCMWRIQVADKWKIQVKFLDFKLSKPNDCERNFLDIFPEQTVMPLRVKNFCGSAGEGITSDSNILHMRFYAEQSAINSTFAILYTAFRERGSGSTCIEGEYDCEDATCIAFDLKCNGRDNCKFRWDEESCGSDEKQSEHVEIIIAVFALILGGMVITFLVNCIRKIVRDQKIIREHIRQSKESKLDEMGRSASKARSRDNISVTMPHRPKHSQASLQILDDVSNHYYRDVVPISVQSSKADLKEKEHSILRHHHDMVVQTSLCSGDDSSATTTAGVPGVGDRSDTGVNACDMGCQTRESLFAASLSHNRSITPLKDDGASGGGRGSKVGSIATSGRFSTFGYDAQQPQQRQHVPSASHHHLRQSRKLPQESIEMVAQRDNQTVQEMPLQPMAVAARPQEMCHHHHQHQQHLQHQAQKMMPYSGQHVHNQQQHPHSHIQHPQQYHQSKVTIPTTVTTVKTTTIPATPSAPSNNRSKQQLQQQQKVDESKAFGDVRNSAPDVIIMTSH